MSGVNDPTPAGGPQASAGGGEAIQATAPPAGSSSAVQTAPAPETPAIPLPPPPPPEPLTPAELGRAMARLDGMVLALVLLLGVLLALFPARNSDLWLHLAAARDWLHHQFTLGTDHYSYTGSGTWVNHSWLTGLLFYGVYQLLGGPALVILKGVLVTALVGVLLSIRRRGQGMWIPAVCTALAVIALSPRLLLQPPVFSFVCLGVTVAVLLRRELQSETNAGGKASFGPVPWLGERGDRWLWVLPPLFALWVNLDAWYFVGPMAVALYLLGTLVEAFLAVGKPNAPRAGSWRPLAVVLAAGLVACLVSPFHVRGLTLPDEIGARAVLAQLQGDQYFDLMLTSPLQFGEYLRPDMGLNIAGLAFFPLVLVGLVSFWLNSEPLRWGRALVWFGFLVMSIVHARAIPFFAVVAAPISVLNFQEYSAARFGIAPIAIGWWKQWSLLGRALSVLALFLLALAAWPGWLFGFPGNVTAQAMADGRHVGLQAEPLPALASVALQLDELHQAGTLRDDDHVLCLQPDVSNTLAWLCQHYHPRGFFDYRFGSYSPEEAADYVKLRQAFDPFSGRAGEEMPALGEMAHVWQPLLKAHQVAFVVTYSGALEHFQAIRARCASARPYLALLALNGHAAVYGLRERPLRREQDALITWLQMRGLPPLPAFEDDPGRFQGREFDPWTLAFGPQAQKLPDVKPAKPQPLSWWVRAALGSGLRTPETADAAVYLAQFEETAFRWHYVHALLPRARLTFCGFAAGTTIQTGNRLADAVAHLARADFALWKVRPAVRTDESKRPIFYGPASLLYLAIRSARRGLQRNPEDAEAYYQLGRAYGLLSRETIELELGGRFRILPQLREIQSLAALRNAVLINPDFGPAHSLLSDHYARAGFDDLNLKHFREFVRWFRRSGRRAMGSSEAFDKAVARLEEDYKKLEKHVSDSQNDYEVKSEKKRAREKAEIAIRLGLAEKALQVLLDSDALEFGKEGTQLELDLMLRTGRLDELREQLAPAKDLDTREKMPDNINNLLGTGSYEFYRAQLAAADGNYDEAIDFVQQAGTKARTDPHQLDSIRREVGLAGENAEVARNLDIPQLLALRLARVVADATPHFAPIDWILLQRLERNQQVYQVQQLLGPLQSAAAFETIAGILSLERGDMPQARGSFRHALFASKEKRGDVQDFVLDFPGLAAAADYLRLIEHKE